MNCYSRLLLDDGKAIAMKFIKEGLCEVRLLKDGRGLSGVVEVYLASVPDVKRQGHTFSRGKITIQWERGMLNVGWDGEHFARISGGAAFELYKSAKEAHEGATAVSEETFARTRVQIVQVVKP